MLTHSERPLRQRAADADADARSTIRAAEDFAAEVSRVRDVLMRFRSNQFRFENGEKDAASAVYTFTAHMNHACSPRCTEVPMPLSTVVVRRASARARARLAHASHARTPRPARVPRPSKRHDSRRHTQAWQTRTARHGKYAREPRVARRGWGPTASRRQRGTVSGVCLSGACLPSSSHNARRRARADASHARRDGPRAHDGGGGGAAPRRAARRSVIIDPDCWSALRPGEAAPRDGVSRARAARPLAPGDVLCINYGPRELPEWPRGRRQAYLLEVRLIGAAYGRW